MLFGKSVLAPGENFRFHLLLISGISKLSSRWTINLKKYGDDRKMYRDDRNMYRDDRNMYGDDRKKYGDDVIQTYTDPSSR